MKLFIPVSHNGGGDGKTGWAISLATAFNGRHVHIKEMGGSHADRACNNMANEFLRGDCDVMLIIDIDTIFRASDIARVIGHIERGHKCIWGLYPKKQDDAPPCVNTWPEVPLPDEHGLVNVRRAGRGFLAITRDVLEMLKEDNGGPASRFHNHDEIEWNFFHSGIVEGEFFSAMIGKEDKDGYTIREWITEDWMFCEDIRNYLGIPTLVDTGIVLAHVGEKTYRFPPSVVARMDSNITSWQEIHGWFDYEDVYRRIVKEIPVGGMFVEVGSWLGRSMGAFHAFAKEADKAVFLHAVDTFQGKPANDTQAAILEAHGGNVEKVFSANMKALSVPFEICVARSTKAAEYFAREDVDAIFIDGDHSKENVMADIAAWYPKVRSGGIMAGHDYDEPGVRAAVDASGLPIEVMGRCWYHRKP